MNQVFEGTDSTEVVKRKFEAFCGAVKRVVCLLSLTDVSAGPCRPKPGARVAKNCHITCYGATSVCPSQKKDFSVQFTASNSQVKQHHLPVREKSVEIMKLGADKLANFLVKFLGQFDPLSGKRRGKKALCLKIFDNGPDNHHERNS